MDTYRQARGESERYGWGDEQADDILMHNLSLPAFEKNVLWGAKHGVKDLAMKLMLSDTLTPLSESFKVYIAQTNVFNAIHSTRLLGSLSMKEETGKEPSQYLLAAGVVSKGDNDDGGISYGAYQLSSKKGTLRVFLREEGKAWAAEFDGLDPTQHGAFGEKWKAIAKTKGEDFFNAQHAFIDQTHYRPCKQYIKKGNCSYPYSATRQMGMR